MLRLFGSHACTPSENLRSGVPRKEQNQGNMLLSTPTHQSPAIHSTIMALAGALHTLRSSLLARISLPVNRLQAVGAAASLSLVRGFAESQYLDKDVVTERVLSVVKNFDKVDPSKVCLVSETKVPGSSMLASIGNGSITSDPGEVLFAS